MALSHPVCAAMQFIIISYDDYIGCLIPGDEDLSTALHHASTVEGGHLSPAGGAGAADMGRETTGRQRVSLKSSTESTSSTAQVSQPTT